MQIISTKEAPQAIAPCSQATASADWVHTSGQIRLDAAGQRVAGGIEEQTEQVFDNLEAVLRAAGASLTGVVSVTVFMADLAEFAAMNAIFARRFGEHRPARSTVQVAALPIGARVEIAAIARIGA